MTELLFVYGTLRSEFRNDWACALRQRGVFLGKASAGGSIYRVGHFPGYWPQPEGAVHGELHEVPDTMFALLDEYEGESFTRVPITLHDGREAWIYQLNSEPAPESRIESGEFTQA